MSHVSGKYYRNSPTRSNRDLEIRGKNFQFYRHNAIGNVCIVFMAFWRFFPRCNNLKNGSKLINNLFEKFFGFKNKKDPQIMKTIGAVLLSRSHPL